jgi:hypothetical protein
MRVALPLFAVFLLIGSSPAVAENWIALWLDNDEFLGVTQNGDVYRYVPATGATEFAGSLGPGPWVSFGRNGEQMLALQPNGQVWGMDASGGTASLYQTLPPDREWCALQQHPDIYAWFAISCDGQIWSLWEPVHLLADFGPCAPGRWISVANADDSYFATLESGDTVQGTWEWCEAAGTFGPGPWVGFSRTYGAGGSFLALNPSGEIWALGRLPNPPTLYLALPPNREWCGLLTGPEWGTGPGYALTCDGEIWSVDSPPVLVGSFLPPTPVESRTWGAIKALWQGGH